MSQISKGDWIEISRIILKPEERASNLPEDTAATPYIMKIRGTALKDGNIGDEILVRTTGGRELKGKAEELNPYYGHDFGERVPELARMRAAIRSSMKEVGK